MSLVDRLTRLVKSDAHGVVDALEDRRLLLRQSLREAEAELERRRSTVDALSEEEGELRGELESLGAAMERAEADIALALSEDEDDLARFAIRKLLPLRDREGEVKEALERVASRREGVARDLAGQEAELEELKERVRAHLARGSEAASRPDGGVRSVADQDVELELLRRKGHASEGTAS